MSLVRLLAVMRKEFIQVRRDKTTLRLVLVMPLMMMFMFGYVVSTDVDSVPAAVALQDPGAPGRELFERFQQTGYFDFTRYVGSAEEVGRLIQAGAVKVGIVIPSDYSFRLERGEQAQVQVLIDGSDPLISRTALSTAELLGQITGSDILAQRLQRLSGGGMAVSSPIEVRARVWYNPDMESLKYNLPGLVGIILQMLTVILIAGAMVREREQGTMEQLVVTPVRPAELILGKIGPYIVIAVIQVALVLLVGVFLFGMEIKGSLWVFGLNTLIFLFGSLGLGLLMSTVAQNQNQANQISQMVALPSMMLSGYLFPREAMPEILQAVGLGIPLTYFLQVIRGVMLKGMGMDLLWRKTAALMIYAVVILALAVWRLRKRLD